MGVYQVISDVCKPKDRKTDWRTPRAIFEAITNGFEPVLDVAADDENSKCAHYFDEGMNGLEQSWAGLRCWLNPPYGAKSIMAWCDKARHELETTGAETLALLPGIPEAAWFHKHVVQGDCYLLCWPERIKFEHPEKDGSQPAGGNFVLAFVKGEESLPTVEWKGTHLLWARFEF